MTITEFLDMSTGKVIGYPRQRQECLFISCNSGGSDLVYAVFYDGIDLESVLSARLRSQELVCSLNKRGWRLLCVTENGDRDRTLIMTRDINDRSKECLV
jgi:hypothetical protein